MLVVDEPTKKDPQLRRLAVVMGTGLFILLVGLWWVQVVSVRWYQAHLETQTYRTIRVPAVRGEILDCEGRVLAENLPTYNLCLYLDDLRSQFHAAYKVEYAHATNARAHTIAVLEKKLGRPLTKTERWKFKFTSQQLLEFGVQARTRVATKIVARLSQILGQQIPLDVKDFEHAYRIARALPYPVLKNLNEEQIAKFEENYTPDLGADLDIQSVRYYPYGTLAAHLLGELRQDNRSIRGEDAFFNYRLPDYRGVTGIEGRFDAELHGRAGVESVLVNNYGYRQSVDVDSQPEAGENVVLTMDLDIQRVATESLARHHGPNADGAVVVMNVRNGDVLAMVSSPAFDPNDFAQGISRAKYAQVQALGAEKNRATYENLAPGSIFKPVVALAALQRGLNPAAEYTVQVDPEYPWHGCIYVGKRRIGDTVKPGKYDLKRALIHSSNAYFINAGLNVAGVENIVRMGQEFHFGEPTGILPGQETRGIFPTLKEVESSAWHDGNTANLCIGQGQMAVTPIQMAVMYSAIANGGTVLWPRLVKCIEPPDATAGEAETNFPSGLVRSHLTVPARYLKILRDDMLGDVESSEGTGTAAAVAGLNICGKTGTAQVQDVHNRTIGHNFWFASFAPYEHPKYVVIVMVQGGMHGSGGLDCAPIAHDIYEEILKKETATQMVAAK